ncbi:helix-turn-helix domain-containing protein [soil metagenome]
MRHRFARENCSVARSLEVLGDWWTLLLVREAMLGTRRFGDFASHLAISRNILTNRLSHLVKHRVFARVDAGTHGQRYEYELTPRGRDLLTLMTALREWGDRWVFGEGKEPLVTIDRRTGKPVPRVRILGEDGQPVPGREIQIELGSGATSVTRKRYRALPTAR